MELWDELGVLTSLRRPVDVMIEGDMYADRCTQPKALDMKIDNAIGVSHFVNTLEGSLVVAQKYREIACDHCKHEAVAQNGWMVRYEPLVFTVQDSCKRHAEALLNNIADVISTVNGRVCSAIKANIL